MVDRGTLSFEQLYSMLLTAIAVGSVLAGILGPAVVLGVSGAICAAAGLIGIAVPSMRTAR